MDVRDDLNPSRLLFVEELVFCCTLVRLLTGRAWFLIPFLWIFLSSNLTLFAHF